MRKGGPRSAEGKMRSRANAVTHGLTAKTLGFLADDELNAFSELFSLGAEDSIFSQQAAAAHLQVRRIQAAKKYALERAIKAISGSSKLPPPGLGDCTLELALIDCADEILTLNAYYGRALSRRRRALEMLLLHQISCSEDNIR